MNRFIWKLGLLVLAIGFNGAVHAIPSQGKARSCAGALSTPNYFTRGFQLEVPQWNDPMSLMHADLEAQSYGNVRTFFSREWDTQVYFTATGMPDKTMAVPLIDPEARAIFIFIHGSGTAKSSGSNFVGNMTALSNLGIAAWSMDLPFHAQGSLRNRLTDMDHFMEWLKKIVDAAAASGKPVYLAGHSFGPEVIFEFMSRYPFAVQGGDALSPAGFDSVTQNWYHSHTVKMKFGGDVESNTAGSEWAGRIDAQATWNRHVRPDPTVLNPRLKLRILSGDREEYIPAPVGGPKRTPTGPNLYDIRAPLQSVFANAVITVEKGVGHYLFDFKDANGDLVVQRELLALLNERPSAAPRLAIQTARQRDAYPASEQVVHRFQVDLIFRAWFLSRYDERMLEEIFRNADQRRAQNLLQEYTEAKEARWQQIMQHIAQTKITDPEFYRENQTRIDDSIQRHRVDGALVALFYKRSGGPPATLN